MVFSDGLREQMRGTIFDILNGGINASQTTITLADATAFPAPGNLYRIEVDTEIMLVTAKSSNVLTVARGIEGTTAASHSTGAEVRIQITAGAIDQIMQENYGCGVMSDAPLGRVMINGSDLSVSDFTWVNQGSATASDKTGGGIVMTMPNETSLNIRGKVIAAPSAPWTLYSKIDFCPGSHPWDSSTRSFMGPMIRDNSTGKIIAANIGDSFNMAFNKYDSPTTFNGNIDSALTGATDSLWVRLRDTNTDLEMHVSQDGANWFGAWSDPRTAFLTPDEIGFYSNSGNCVAGTPFLFYNWVVVDGNP